MFSGNIISVLMFLSPVQTFLRIVKNGSTEEFESLPYICTLLNSSLWTYYGITKPGSYLVATVNGFGVVVEIIYVALFLLFAPPSKRAKTAIMFAVLNVGFLAAAVSLTYLLLHGEMRIDAVGFMSSGLNIILFSLAAMKTVVTRKQYYAFPSLFFHFLEWRGLDFLCCARARLVPNGIGFVLGTLQPVLSAIYT
ncbi:hypothetical protein Pfo_005218, partial [Paulownia fortunei]